MKLTTGAKLLEDPYDIYQNFYGRQLLVTSFENWPFMQLTGTEEPIGTIGGIDHNVLGILSNQLNFT